MTYTTGKWIVDDSMEQRGPSGEIISIRIAQQESGGAIADVYANCLVNTDAECEANARLIRTAPALLDALRTITERYVRLVHWNAESEPEVISARCVIAMASAPIAEPEGDAA